MDISGCSVNIEMLTEQPLISMLNFSDDFDAGMIWGPVMGVKVFSGIRMKFND
jgi:hypothetical protein